MHLVNNNIHYYVLLYSFEQGWGQVQLTKYSSTLSTQNMYQVQVSTHFFKQYLSTSSTFISSTSTSTSTHIKTFHWSLISIQWYIYVVWIKERDLPQIISLF